MVELPGFHNFRFLYHMADFASLGIKDITLFQVGDPVGLLLVFFSFVLFGVGGRGGVGLVGGGRRVDQGDVLVGPEPS
jgi:hypothetical protein